MKPDEAGSPASLPGHDEDHVLVQLKLTAGDLGVDPPPSRCHLRAYKTTTGWVLLVWTRHGPTEATRAWARAQAKTEEFSFGEVGRRTIAFRCDRLPAAWETLFGVFGARHLAMESDGTAQTHLEGSREEIGEFLTGLETDLTAESVRAVEPADDQVSDAILTAEQARAVGRAAALGYFEVPRRINLEKLAEELGTSTSALSELLRRAQGRLVSVYLDNELGGLGAVLDLEVSSR